MLYININAFILESIRMHKMLSRNGFKAIIHGLNVDTLHLSGPPNDIFVLNLECYSSPKLLLSVSDIASLIKK